MEPIKIGVASVQDRKGGGRGAPRRGKKKRRPPSEAEAAEAQLRTLAPPEDAEDGDAIKGALEESFVGRHLNIVA